MISEIDHYLKRLFPLNRSLTGSHNVETLKILQEIIPLNVLQYHSGEQVYDWTIPDEWELKEAWIKDKEGNVLVDLQNSNLHVMSYSQSVSGRYRFSELKQHLHYLKDLPKAIPYRTSYYADNWAFCVSYEQFLDYFSVDDEEVFEVFISSKKKKGVMPVGELLIEGRSRKEYLISSYICHPSMANDSLSGVLSAAFLAKHLLSVQETLEFSYRVVFVPETIGAIAYAAKNEQQLKEIDVALVMTTCGGPGKFGYKQSWEKSHYINELVEQVFNSHETEYIKYPFDIHGSDERQYASQAFRINTITITKDKYYEYPYYHTSLDDLNFVKAEYIAKTVELYKELLSNLDKNIIYKNTMTHCEVMLSKHDLYPKNWWDNQSA